MIVNPYEFVENSLRPDWDVTEETHARYEGKKFASATYIWIRGHQDDECSPEELPIQAQYNVKADELEGKINAQNRKSGTESKNQFS